MRNEAAFLFADPPSLLPIRREYFLVTFWIAVWWNRLPATFSFSSYFVRLAAFLCLYFGYNMTVTKLVNYAPLRVHPPPLGWMDLVPLLIFERMSSEYSPGKYEPDYQGGLHPQRVKHILAVYIVYACFRQIYMTKGGRRDPHYQIPPWRLEDFISECSRLGVRVVPLLAHKLYVVSSLDPDPDWFLQVWNYGTPEWTDDIQQLYESLRFPEVADIFSINLKSLVVYGRGVLQISAGITAQSFVERHFGTFVWLPSLTKYTPMLKDFFVPMTNLARRIGYVLEEAMDPFLRAIFPESVHPLNLLDNITPTYQDLVSSLLKIHCNGFNSDAEGRQGFFTAKYTYLEHDQEMYDKGFPEIFRLKTCTQIGYMKKACDDFKLRVEVLGPLVEWVVSLYFALPPIVVNPFRLIHSPVVTSKLWSLLCLSRRHQLTDYIIWELFFLLLR